MIKPVMFFALAAGATVAAAPATAGDRAWPADRIGKETSIPFVGTIGLYDFEPDSDRGAWLQDRQRRWYYARILAPCTALPFATRIGVDARFGATGLDRTGTLLVDRERCRIDSLTMSAGPPKRVKKKG